MVDWANLNKNLSYISDGLQFGLDLMRPKKEGETIGDKVTTAGINLFGNAAATQNAAELREHTGSNLGYVAKSVAGDNAQQALFNTMQASLFTHQTNMMFGGCYGPMMGGCYGPMAGGYYAGGMWDTLMPGGAWGPGFCAPSFPGSSTFQSSFFRNGWFG